MARGLSDLQKWILVRALDCPDNGYVGDGVAMFSNRIVSEYYGIPFVRNAIEARFVGDAVQWRRVRSATP